MIAIVTGGRTYSDADRVKAVLDAAVERLGLNTIIEGECPTGGLDRLAREWAMERGDISMIAVEPDDNWPSAGPRRNLVMLKILQGSEDRKAVFAFDGGRGTAGMVSLAKNAGVAVHGC